MAAPYNPYAHVDAGNGYGLTYQDRSDRYLPINDGVRGGGTPTAQPRAAAGNAYESPTAVAKRIGTPYEDVGKTNVSLPPYAPPVREEVDFTKAPQATPGLAEGMLRGLTDLFSGVLPGDPAQRGTVRGELSEGMGRLGSLVDLPLEALTHVPVGGPDVRQAFEMLPDTAEKGKIEKAYETAPDVALQWMAQYIRNHETEFSQAMGVPRITADLFMPDSTILERGLALLSIPQMAVGRTYAGMDMRNLDETVVNAQPESLPAPLQDLQARYKRGDLGPMGSQQAKDALLDELTATGYAFTNDSFVNFALGVVTDPVILASFGTGLAVKAVETGAVAARTVGAVSAFERLEPALYSATRQTVIESRIARAMAESPGISREAAERLAMNDKAGLAKPVLDELGRTDPARHSTYLDHGMQSLSRGGRAAVAMEPIIRATADIAHGISEPFGVFGRDRAGRAIGQVRTNAHVRAMYRSYGLGNVRRAFDAMSNAGTEALARGQRAIGVYAANSEMAIHGGSLADQMVNNGIGTPIADQMRLMSPNEAITRGVAPSVSPNRMEIESGRFHNQHRPDFNANLAAVTEAERPVVEKAYRAKQERLAAQRYADATGVPLTTAMTLFKGADDKMLGFAHAMGFGQATIDMIRARTTAAEAIGKDLSTARGQLAAATTATAKARWAKQVEKLEAQATNVHRYTLVGSAELTQQLAAEILKIARSGAPDAAARLREAIARYDILRANFGSRLHIDDEALKTRVATFLDDGLQAGDAFVVVVKDLPAEMADFISHSKSVAEDEAYQIGLAPSVENQWRIAKDLEDNIVGVHPWVELVDDVATVGTPTKLDQVREALFVPIRGERLLNEAKRSFTKLGGRLYGLSSKEAESLFGSVRKAGNERGLLPRALTSNELQHIVKQVDISEEARQALGNDGLTILVAKAFEGDIAAVGASSRLSGKMKSSSARWGNFVGVVAERLYPMVRFGLNPFFQLQEAVEPYFFNILRGVKPGFKWSAEDRAMLEMLDRWGITRNEFDEQAEYTYINSQGWMNTAVDDKFGRGGAIAARNEQYIGVRSVKERKFLNYVRETQKIGGDNFKRAVIESTSRGVWDDLTSHYGTTDPGKVALQFWIDKGMFHPDDPKYALFHSIAVTPSSMGAKARVDLGMTARTFGYLSENQMRTAINAGTMDEARFMAHPIVGSWDQEFRERTWRTAAFPTPAAWKEGLQANIERGGADTKAAAAAASAFFDLTRSAAANADMTHAEWLASRLTGPSVFLDSSKDLPIGALTQAARGFAEGLREMRPTTVVASAGDEVFERVRARGRELGPKPGEARIKDQQNAKKGHGPQHQPAATKGRRYEHGDTVMHVGAATDDELLELAERTLQQDLDISARWYDEVPALAIAIGTSLTDAQVERMLAHIKGKGVDVGKHLDDPREELSARIMVGFGTSQQNASPLVGIQNLSSVLEALTTDARAAADSPLFGGKPEVEKRIRSMLDTFDPELSDSGHAAKLYDFIDSILGNTTRSILPGDTLQPGAMDIWMGRTFGFYDKTHVMSMAQQLVRMEEAPDLVSAVRQVLDDAGLRKPIGPVREGMGAAEEIEWLISNVDDAPTSSSGKQYEVALQRMNDVLRRANETNFGGRSNWTGPEIQAALWVSTQKQVGLTAGELGSLARWQNVDVSFEAKPSKAGMERVPNANDTAASVYPSWNGLLEKHGPDAMAMVSQDVANGLAPIIEDLTGVTITNRPIPGVGRWRAKSGVQVAPNTSWSIFGNDKQIEDALDAMGYLLQQDEIFATRPARPAGPMAPITSATGAAKDLPGSRTNDGRYWALDWTPRDPKVGENPTVMAALGEFMMRSHGTDLFGHMTARDLEARPTLRSVWMHDKGTKTLAHFEKAVKARDMMDNGQPVNVAKVLEDGTWVDYVADSHPGLDPVPVDATRQVVEVKRSTNAAEKGGWADDGLSWENQRLEAERRAEAEGLSPEETHAAELGRPYLDRLAARGREDLGGRLVGEHRIAVQRLVESAYERLDPEWTQRARGQRLLNEQGNPFTVRHQRDTRGVRGAISYADGERATLHILKRASADTGVHELLHIFARELDPSGRDAVVAAYNATLSGGGKRASKAWRRTVEEWAAEQFVDYVAGGSKVAPKPALRPIFDAFGDWAKGSLGRTPREVDPAVRAVFDKFLATTDPTSPRATYDLDQFRLLGAARDSFARGEETAHTAQYYKRGRSWTERSVNHPYLGLYPASYMWGKVLPEMARFLLKEPFGVKAPLGGAALTSHLAFYFALMMQEHDDWKAWFDDHPKMIRFLQMLLPGTPWDIPVNAPAYLRHLTGDVNQNRLRVQNGLEPKAIDPAGYVTDTINYAMGTERNLTSPLDLLSEFAGVAGETVTNATSGGPALGDPERKTWEAQRTAALDTDHAEAADIWSQLR